MVTRVASHDYETLGPLWARFSSVKMGIRIGSFGSSFEPSVVAHLIMPTLRRPREDKEVRARLTCAVGLCLKKQTSLVALSSKRRNCAAQYPAYRTPE